VYVVKIITVLLFVVAVFLLPLILSIILYLIGYAMHLIRLHPVSDTFCRVADWVGNLQELWEVCLTCIVLIALVVSVIGPFK
jgi:hypothetical protein